MAIEFKDVFSSKLGVYKHKIFKLQMKDTAVPIVLKPRPVPLAHKEKIEAELKRLEDAGVIVPTESSEGGTPLVPVLKKDGGIRLCGDHRVTVNKHIQEVRYPLPLIDELFAKLNGGKTFSKIDLSNAYNQLVLDEESSKVLTWSTHKGFYKVTRLPFGITTASALFQRTIEQTLQGLDGVANFLDDIIITGTSTEEHEKNLRAVFAKLSNAGFKINLNKCKFFQKEVSFLGHTITQEGIKKSDNKIMAILKAPTTATHNSHPSKKLRRYGELLQFVWTNACNQAFEEIKKIIASDEVLIHFNPKLPIVLTTDASNDGVAGVLTHKLGNGDTKPIGFVSRTLSIAERNYAAIDKEVLAIVWAIKKFSFYLKRWILFLSGFSYNIQYIKGANNRVADMLSRHPIDAESGTEEQAVPTVNLIISEGIPIDAETIHKETVKDTTLKQIHKFVMNGWPEKINDEKLIQFSRRKQQITTEGGCLLWGDRIIIPEVLRKRLLEELHALHLGIVKMKSIARSYFWWPNMDKQIELITKACKACIITGDDPRKTVRTPWHQSSKPWERVHVDYLGPIKNDYYFVMIDSFSKWPEIFRTKRMTAEVTIQKLRESFCRWGIPETLVSDNGTQLVSNEVEKFLERNGVHHVTSPPYHPASNGAAENTVKSFKRGMNSALLDPKNAGVDPDVLVASKNVIRYIANEGKRNLSKPEHQKFAINEKVFIRDFRDSNKMNWIEAIVTKQIGSKIYEMKIGDNGRTTRRHIDHIKKYIPTKETEQQPRKPRSKQPAENCNRERLTIACTPKPPVPPFITVKV
ncbi:uncharacterized protein K02A2.6-like [Zophobas morio]|uniref:uncharacterized protein K02A2.6-like n=1 Tax=Zophobas morio TaxID=2755281 RepID=UPI003082FA5D